MAMMHVEYSQSLAHIEQQALMMSERGIVVHISRLEGTVDIVKLMKMVQKLSVFVHIVVHLIEGCNCGKLGPWKRR